MTTIKQVELINLAQEIYEEQNETNPTKKEAETWIKAIFTTVFEALELGYDVQVGKTGKLEQRVRKARKGRNPQTGEEIDIAEAKAIGFKSSKTLKTAINATE